MATWYDAFGAEYNASNSNYTDQSQSNPTAVSGSGIHSVDVHNDQSNATFQQADAGSGGYEAPSFGSYATNYNETHQYQNNPTLVLGDHIGSVDVHNGQSNETFQQADAHSGGYEAPWSGGFAGNANETHQFQNDPTLVFGGSVHSVDVHNDQSNATFQQADAGSGGFGLHGFPSSAEAGNFNTTTQVQANPTIVIGDHIGSVDVHNSQSNVTEQLALAHH